MKCLLSFLMLLCVFGFSAGATDADLGFFFQQTLNYNVLGPIVFVTPEIGRFSTVGGMCIRFLCTHRCVIHKLITQLLHLSCLKPLVRCVSLLRLANVSHRRLIIYTAPCTL